MVRGVDQGLVLFLVTFLLWVAVAVELTVRHRRVVTGGPVVVALSTNQGHQVPVLPVRVLTVVPVTRLVVRLAVVVVALVRLAQIFSVQGLVGQVVMGLLRLSQALR
jgi:hypothetical protein